jgi:hypothetical protein
MSKSDSKIEVIEADNFPVETKYRMTLKHEGETFYWIGFAGEYGQVEEWYDSDERKIVEPDWSEEVDCFFHLCEEKEKDNKKSFDWIVTKVEQVIPSASFDEDNSGQIIIYTGLTEDETGTVQPFDSEKEEVE